MSKSKHRVWNRRAALVVCAASGCTSITSTALATNYTWTPAGVNNNWSTATNWTDQNGANVVPPLTPPAGDVTDLIFGGSFTTNQTSTQNVGEIEVNSLVFNANFSAATLNLSGSSTGNQFIRLGAGGLVGNVPIVAGAGTVAISVGANRKIILTADQTWSNTNTSAIISARRIMEGAFKITKTGPGTIEFQGDGSAWTGGLQIDQGTIRTAAENDALGVGPLTVNTSNNVAISASGTAQVDQLVAGAVTLGGSGTFSLVGSWNVAFNNTVTLLNDKNFSVSNTGSMNGAIGGNFRITKVGGGSMVLNAAANTHAGFDVRGGSLVASSDAQLGVAGAAVGIGSSLLSGGTMVTGTLRAAGAITSLRNINLLDESGGAVDTAGNDVTFANVTGPGGFTKEGAGRLLVNHVRTASATVNAGKLQVGGEAGAGSPDGTSKVGALTIAGGVTPTATLDLSLGAMAVDYPVADAEPFDTIRAQVINAYNAGAWDLPGITSTAANASTHGVGYGEASAVFTTFPADFIGQSVDATTVLLRYTRYGDADLNGVVNLGDFNRLAANFGSTTAVWTQGDFNYDGNVNLSDFNRLAANFGQNAAGTQVTPQDWANLAAAIPEPSAGALLGVVATAVLRRRRRA